MLITNQLKHDRRPFTDVQTNPKLRETAMTEKVTIFGKNS